MNEKGKANRAGYQLLICLATILLLASPALATHIQYVDVANEFDGASASTVTLDANTNTSWSHTFDLTTDLAYLWYIPEGVANAYTPGSSLPDVTTAEATGSFDPTSSVLHYAYLRIDPNNVNLDGSPPSEPAATYLALSINGHSVDLGDPDWENPVDIYLWGVPNGTVEDPYGLLDNGYKVVVELKVTDALGVDKVIELTNVNIEGCYEVPEPTTVLLFGMGVFGIAFAGKRRYL